MKRPTTSLLAVLFVVAGTAATAGLEPEKATVEVLPEPAPHWVWINDINILALDSTPTATSNWRTT